MFQSTPTPTSIPMNEMMCLYHEEYGVARFPILQSYLVFPLTKTVVRTEKGRLSANICEIIEYESCQKADDTGDRLITRKKTQKEPPAPAPEALKPQLKFIFHFY